MLDMSIETVPHPPYSSDLAPYDFWMFPKLNKTVKERRYDNVQRIKVAVTNVRSVNARLKKFSKVSECDS